MSKCSSARPLLGLVLRNIYLQSNFLVSPVGIYDRDYVHLYSFIFKYKNIMCVLVGPSTNSIQYMTENKYQAR